MMIGYIHNQEGGQNSLTDMYVVVSQMENVCYTGDRYVITEQRFHECFVVSCGTLLNCV